MCKIVSRETMVRLSDISPSSLIKMIQTRGVHKAFYSWIKLGKALLFALMLN